MVLGRGTDVGPGAVGGVLMCLIGLVATAGWWAGYPGDAVDLGALIEGLASGWLLLLIGVGLVGSVLGEIGAVPVRVWAHANKVVRPFRHPPRRASVGSAIRPRA